MSNLVISGGHVLTPVHERFASVLVRNGKIDQISDNPDSEGKLANFHRIDADGCYVTPGLIDIQVNGDQSCNLWGDPTADQLREMNRSLAKAGVTSYLPTLITGDLTHLRKNVDLLTSWGAGVKEKWEQAPDNEARMLGIHLEGPCLSPKKPGVHPPEWIKPPSVDLLKQIVNDSVKLVTMACELDHDNKSIEWLEKRNVVVSLGHSNATFEEAKRAFDSGVQLMTHTFNALPAIHHRDPGAVLAALLDERVTCCMIADGLHLAPQAAELILKMKGPDKTILVTDIAQIGTTGGGLVGSSITLDKAVRNVVKWGIATFREAILMSTFNAAKAIGLEHAVGIIETGAIADFVIWDINTLEIKHVIVGGKLVETVCA